MKKIILMAAILCGSAAYAGESYEVCTPEGPCALRVTDTDTGNDVWLVTEDSTDLSTIWDGTYWIVSDSDYQMIAAAVPERIMLPAIEPTSGKAMERKGGSSTSKGGTSTPKSGGSTSSGGSQGGSLISVGNISVGGGSGCADCHKGSMYEIHKKVMDQK